MYRLGMSRTILQLALATSCFCLAGCVGTRTGTESSAHGSSHAVAHAEGARITPLEANRRLIEGNARFVAGSGQHPRQDSGRRAELASTQHPFAVILGCADSRTGPEILFDQGLGVCATDSEREAVLRSSPSS